jgi:hypothetical protein
MAWFETNCRNDYGYEFDGNEIYWITSIGPADGLIETGSDPGLSIALRRGGNEGYILLICANLRFSYQGGKLTAYSPILQLKVWTAEAGAAIGSAVMRAALEMFELKS